MLSITFQGLCGIARKKGHSGSDAYLPFNKSMTHTAVLMARGADLQSFTGSNVWQPDAVGLDAQDRVVCFWYLHHPAKAGNLAEKLGLRMLVEGQGGTASAPPCVFFGGKPAVPLAAQYSPAQAKSTEDELLGTRICLPTGCVTGLGADALFDLIDANGKTTTAGPFAELLRWQSLSDVEPEYWLISYKAKVGKAWTSYAIGLKRHAAITISNVVPEIADTDIASHFDGIYEAVLKPSDDPIDPLNRYSLQSRIVVLSVDEGVNCIPPGETPPTEDPDLPPLPAAVVRALTRRPPRKTMKKTMGARKK